MCSYVTSGIQSAHYSLATPKHSDGNVPQSWSIRIITDIPLEPPIHICALFIKDVHKHNLEHRPGTTPMSTVHQQNYWSLQAIANAVQVQSFYFIGEGGWCQLLH